MKRHTPTPYEKLRQQIWHIWPDATEWQDIDIPFDSPFRQDTLTK
jgi:hypothetical protein